MLVKKFAEAVETFPEHIALKMETETYTYERLNRYANRAAAEMIALAGLGPKGKTVALLFEYGTDMIIGLIAALKINMVYVPLDRTYPENRLLYLLEDSEAALVLTDTANLPLARRLAREIKRPIALLNLREACTGHSEREVNRTTSGEAPAYILYTSGTTGKPKGVVQNHENVLYYTRNWIQRFSIAPGDRMTLLTAFGHDGFVQDLWSALLSGATLYPFDMKKVVGQTRLWELVKNEKITLWHSVPTLFRYFADTLPPGEVFPLLRFVLLGGEALRKHDFDIFKRHFPNATLANIYGQTESSVNSIALYTQEDLFGLPLLGTPPDKTEVLLLTEEGEILEEMGTGEIVIACDHIALGYWQDEKHTAEKFSRDPDLGKLYRTGDLGRLKGNGEITLVGRKDFQIKIRGFRVEVGEIETVLLRHDAVKQAAVIMKETNENEPYLCCYFTAKQPLDPARLREYLLHQIPDYMIPKIFMPLKQLPLTSSGKIDRNVLPDPDSRPINDEYQPPLTEVERRLAAIWQEVLKIKPAQYPIGLDDNFFERGGHSLRAIQLIARVHKIFQVKLELEEVFSFPLLKELARLVESKTGELFKAIHPVEKKQYYPLSSAQKRLFFLRQMEPEGTGYNLSNIMESEEEIDIKKVEETFKKLVQRHESLRTSFHMIDGQPVQRIGDTMRFEIEYYDLAAENTEVENYNAPVQKKGRGRMTKYKQIPNSKSQITNKNHGVIHREESSLGNNGSNTGTAQDPKSQELRAKSCIYSFIRSFDLSRAPLFRVGIIWLEENKHLFMIDMHHIISDGTSQEIFSEDFQRLYRGEGLLSLRLQYREYSAWQNSRIEQDVLKPQETYWLETMGSDIPIMDLPYDAKRPLTRSFAGANLRFSLEESESVGLKQLAQQEEVTLYMVLGAAVNVLLFKLSNQEDIAVGTPVAGRSHADLEGIIGMFVNTLVLRNSPEGDKPFVSFLKEVRETTLKAFANQEYPFEELVDRVVTHRDLGRNPLFDVMFALHNQSTLAPPRMRFQDTGCSTSIPFAHNTSKVDLSIHAIETGQVLGFSVEYSTILFKTETIRRFIRYLKTIIGSILENPHRKLSDIDLLSTEELEQLLVEFNRTDVQYPRQQTLHQLFAAQVAQTPDHIALLGPKLPTKIKQGKKEETEENNIPGPLAENVFITYKQLNDDAGGLAHLLRKKGVGPDIIAGIMVERSVEMIVGIMGILKAGGAYLPIDPEYPPERVNYLLKNSKVHILLVDDFSCTSWLTSGPPALFNLSAGHPDNSHHSSFSTDDSRILAYLIYTSGTTGKPKGVLVRHQEIVNALTWRRDEYRLGSADVSLQLFSFCFDAFVTGFFTPVISGARVVLLEEKQGKDIAKVREAIFTYKVTHFIGVPVLVKVLTAAITVKEASSLKVVTLGGETIPVSLVDALKAKNQEIEIIIEYGVTEAAVVSTFYRVREKEGQLAIGKPIANTAVYIVGKQGQPQPGGVPGELWIAGAGLARGYINSPEFTAEKFCLRRPGDLFEKRSPGPSKNFLLEKRGKIIKGFSGGPGGRFFKKAPLAARGEIYKTGDLARWLPGGDIEFLGRIDHQVKIRGYRIEPGEIEKQVLAYEKGKIKTALVIPREDRDKDRYLCGYLTASHDIDIPDLKKHLALTLPGYMIPPFFLQLQEIPLNSSGKVDRNALPGPKKEKIGHGFSKPANVVEQGLAVLWSRVLGIGDDKIGALDNFFELGGHSLKATQLSAHIHKVFNIKIPLAEIFKAPHIRGIAQYISRAAEERFSSIEKAGPAEYYPLSSAQKRLLVLQQMEAATTVYNMPQFIPLKGRIDKDKLEQVFRQLIARHESLRTSFHMVNEEPVQKIHDDVEFELDLLDIKDSLKRFIRPFDLSQAPLLRVGLANANDGNPILMLDLHHIIADGESMEILAREFTDLYHHRELAPLPLRYKDYALWQNRRKIGETTLKQENYWLTILAGEIPVLQLPYDFPRPGIWDSRGGKFQFEIGNAQTIKLKQLALTRGVTLYMLLLAAFTLLMSRLSSQEDILIGTPTAGRPHADLEGIIGMFVNTLVIRTWPNGEKTVHSYLSEIKTTTLEAFAHQDYQFEDLVDKVAVNRDPSRNPLFDVMFSLRHSDAAMHQSLPAAEELIPYPCAGRAAKFDITLECTDRGETLFFLLEYAAALFKPETLRRWVSCFKLILSALLTHLHQPLAEIQVLTEEEKQQLLVVFNDTAVDFPADKTLQQLFQEQVEKNADRTALIGQEPSGAVPFGRISDAFAGGHLSYKELNERSKQLARYLMEKGAGPDTIVGIMTGPSLAMVVGIMGILKAGGAYMPIDPEYPQDRIDFMLKDSSAKILLTRREIASLFLLEASNNRPKGTPFFGIWNLESGISPRRGGQLAYVIYTSGTTGLPKGVLIQHRGLVNMVAMHRKIFKENCRSRISQVANFAFDALAFEVWPCLLSGACLCIADDNIKPDPAAMKAWLVEKCITISFQSTSLAELLLQEEWTQEGTALRALRTAGDRLTQYPSRLYPFRLYNLYGPTEDTVWTTWAEINVVPEASHYPFPPIGKPIDHHRVLILNPKNQALQPVGVPGELSISGVGLARGYLNNPELTAEKFCLRRPGGALFKKTAPPGPPCKNFLLKGTGKKIYKTGDLVRWLPDGNIEFLGRIDQQVKIRGFRIEPGEIENRLLSYKGVGAAVVIPREDETGDRFLCAYLVSDNELDIPPLKEYLSHSLPGYMIPFYFIRVEQIPLTVNGKVDRKALPKPVMDDRPAVLLTPADWWEEQMIFIWSDLFKIPKETLSVDANFFAQGGHSLKATLLIGKIHRVMKVKIPLAQVFRNPTVRGLAAYIKKLFPNERYTAIEPAESKEFYALSPTQRGIFLLHKLDCSSTAYHIPFSQVMSGEVDKQRFAGVMQKLIRQHGSLRTSFNLVEGEPVQRLHDKVELEIEYDDIKNFIRPFDLSLAPLFRVGLIRLEEKKHLLVIDLHHIVCDGTSVNILVGDFLTLLQGSELAPLRLQYKDYSQWQNSRQRQEIMTNQGTYWHREFEGQLPLLTLPLDFPRPAVQEFAGNTLAFELSLQETQAVKAVVLNENVSIYMMVLAVFSLLMARLSGQEDIIVGTPTAGRNQEDLHPVVGMFVNTLALRNLLLPGQTFAEFLQSVKENTLTAFENQDYPFEQLVERLGSRISRNMGRNPLFDVMVAPQDVLEVDLTETGIPGLTLEPSSGESSRHRTTKFDLTLVERETPDQLFFSLSYRTRLFKAETIQRWIDYFKNLLAEAVNHPQQRIGHLEILSQNEKQQILEGFNDTAVEYPAGKTLHLLFREQVRRIPDRTALVGKEEKWQGRWVEGKKEIARGAMEKFPGPRIESPGSYMSYMTYIELNNQADRLTHLLLEKGAGPDTLVGMMVERSAAMIIGMLGILKAGSAYLPIDPAYPQERINYILKDSGLQILVVDDASFFSCPSWLAPAPQALLNLSAGHPFNIRPSILPSFHPSRSSSLAYLIYTSGSTGKPKGVMVEHGSAVNVVTWFGRRYCSDGNSRVLQLSAYTFDASINQIYGTLLQGAVLLLVDKELQANLARLRHYIEVNEITLINSVPQFLKALLLGHPRLKSVKTVISGGDQLDMTIKDKFLEEGYTLYNQYGPTETTVDALAGCCARGPVTLGRPIANVNCYIIDRNNNISPIGAAGELLISGAGVARGYLNNPELTVERFDQDLINKKLFQGVQGGGFLEKSPPGRRRQKLYKTGDLVRWSADGTIQFLGRKDHQVKIRGNRVEPGEIENQLRRIKGIRDAVVIARASHSNEKYLCAYVVSGEETGIVGLRDELGQRLPSYMIPDFFIPLEQIPLDPNGKIDRDALPEPGFPLASDKPCTPPRNSTETKLLDIWVKVLFPGDITGVSFGIDDNFFQLGGNSLKALRLISRVHEAFRVEIPMDLIFKTPFIRDLAAYLMQSVSAVGDEEIVVLLNPGRPGADKIFCFPPAVGYGISYMQLAVLLKGHSLYAFNYIEGEDQGEDRMERYLATLRSIQPEGPYTLLGYSAGGRLCLHAAEFLEKQGNQVRDIILLDCYSQRKSLPMDAAEELAREFNDELKQGLRELGLEPMIDRVMERMEKYVRYHGRLKAREPVPLRAGIHLIKALDKWDQEGFIGWEAYTTGEYREYEGSGIHREMLSAGFIENNAALINDILAGAAKEAKEPLPAALVLGPELRHAHEILSASSVTFLEFVQRHPEALNRSYYRELQEKTGSAELQPWPTFIDQRCQKAMAEAALTTCNLIRSIPKRIFNLDPHLMSRYYQLPVNMIETQLNGISAEFLGRLIARGDFVLTASGFKCLEFNIAANIGGLHLSIWQEYYLENPVIARFLKEHQVKLNKQDSIAIFFEHLVGTARETLTHLDHRLNIAMAASPDPNRRAEKKPAESEKTVEMELHLRQIYARTLHQVDRQYQGNIIFCDFDDLVVREDCLYYRDQPVHILVESSEGAVPPEIMTLFQARRLCLFNGPVTGLLSNKLNLALLSGQEDAPCFSEKERQAIKTFIPWTRKIIPSETVYHGQPIQLIEFIRQNREQLVIKPAVGYGGQGVTIGKNTLASHWESVLQKALREGNWLVQEYVSSLPLLYQAGENGAEPHAGVWGFLVFGNRYGGGSLRLLPSSHGSGIVNVHQGARASALLEVEK